jgi:hypothetical protein
MGMDNKGGYFFPYPQEIAYGNLVTCEPFPVSIVNRDKIQSRRLITRPR